MEKETDSKLEIELEKFKVTEIEGEHLCTYSMKISEIEEKYPIEKIQGVVSVLHEKVFMLPLHTTFKDLCDPEEELTVDEYKVNYDNEHDKNEYILVRIKDELDNFAEFVMN